MKLLLHSTLQVVERLIILETDQLVLANIEELWREFLFFKDNTLIGAVENYQPWRDSRPFDPHETDERQQLKYKENSEDDHGYGSAYN